MAKRASQVKIKDEKDKNEIRDFSNVKLELFIERSGHVLVMTLSPGEEIELDLKDCSYIDESSIKGRITCIRDNRKKELVTIIDRNQECVEILDDVYEYLSRKPVEVTRKEPDRRERERIKSRSRSPSPRFYTPPRQLQRSINTEKVNRLLKAFNDGNANNAAAIASELARDHEPVRFVLDMINESGNDAPRPPPRPVQEPIKLRLAIENFLAINNDQTYDMIILHGTTIKDLKGMVNRDAGVPPEQQFWYIDRDYLPDNYIFGETRAPRVNIDTILILYIAKPQND